MRNGCYRVKGRVWGPRAVAVISCALALLAAQPVMGASGRGAVATATVVRAEGGGAVFGGVVREERVSRSRRAEGAILGSGRRLHVLATIEILQRWLAAELRPVERQAMVGMVFVGMDLRVFEGVVGNCQKDGVAEARGVSRERAFLIVRCLLAPPVGTV